MGKARQLRISLLAAFLMLPTVPYASEEIFVDRAVIKLSNDLVSTEYTDDLLDDSDFVLIDMSDVHNIDQEVTLDKVKDSGNSPKRSAEQKKFVASALAQRTVRVINPGDSDTKKFYRISVNLSSSALEENTDERIVVANEVLLVIEADMPVVEYVSHANGKTLKIENITVTSISLSEGEKCHNGKCSKFSGSEVYPADGWKFALSDAIDTRFRVADHNRQ